MKLAKIVLLGCFFISKIVYGQKVKDVDGNSYGLTTINNLQWMTSNLSVKRFKNGEKIMQAQSKQEWTYAAKNKIPAWCYYEDENGVDTKTILYNWFAVVDSRGLAPEGTHIPTFSEWNAFSVSLGGIFEAAGKIKSKTGWETPQNLVVDPANSFNAKPVGSRYVDLEASSSWIDGISKSKYTNFWTTSSLNYDPKSSCARRMGLAYDVDFLIDDSNINFESILQNKGNGFSVRCVVDVLP